MPCSDPWRAWCAVTPRFQERAKPVHSLSTIPPALRLSNTPAKEGSSMRTPNRSTPPIARSLSVPPEAVGVARSTLPSVERGAVSKASPRPLTQKRASVKDWLAATRAPPSPSVTSALALAAARLSERVWVLCAGSSCESSASTPESASP